NTIFNLGDPEREALLGLERAIAEGNAANTEHAKAAMPSLSKAQQEALAVALQGASKAALDGFLGKVRTGMPPDEVAKLDAMINGKSEAEVHKALGDSVAEAQARIRSGSHETTGGEVDPAAGADPAMEAWSTSKAQADDLAAAKAGNLTPEQR